jgi:hypothetical protein
MELTNAYQVSAGHYKRNERIHPTLFCWSENFDRSVRATNADTLEEFTMSQNQNQNPNQRPGQQQQGKPSGQPGQHQGGGQKQGQQQGQQGQQQGGGQGQQSQNR